MIRTEKTKLKPVSRASPCEVCGKDHKCARGEDGLLVCGRVNGEVSGYVRLGSAKGDDQFTLYRREDDPRLEQDAPTASYQHNGNGDGPHANNKPIDWDIKAKSYAKNLTPPLRAELAAALGLPESVFESLRLGFNPRGYRKDEDHPEGCLEACWTFAETDSRGTTIGIGQRFRDGRKTSMSGGNRGLSIPDGWRERPGPVLVVEGPSDTLALTSMALPAVGRPSNCGGVEHLADLLGELPADRKIIILGEMDPKQDGKWPGRDGAVSVASKLSAGLSRVIQWALPPKGAKDVRDWLLSRRPALTCADELHDLGGEFVARLKSQDAAPNEEKAASHTAGGEFSIPQPTPWPGPLDKKAFHGIGGQIVDTIAEHSEADPAALLIQFLAAFGNIVGRSAYWQVEADRHFCNLFAVLVGKTAEGRKGTSWGHIRQIFSRVEEAWAKDRVLGGLSSGEGLIWAVRDAITQRQPIKERGRVSGYQEVETDPGVSDKRLLCIEPEFASVLRMIERQGNCLSSIVRLFWETGDVRTMTKNNPARTTGAHVSILGHVTVEELRRYLTATEQGNGFGNRFLWVCAKRAKNLPEGGQLKGDSLNEFVNELVFSVEQARTLHAVGFDSQARELWHSVYDNLSRGKPGLAGSLVGRAEAQTRRLAVIYALLDQSAEVKEVHLSAALAVWNYCAASARYIFGDSLGDPVAHELLRFLQASPAGRTRTEIRDFFGRHQSAERIAQALGVLISYGKAKSQQQASGGRPVERWVAV